MLPPGRPTPPLPPPPASDPAPPPRRETRRCRTGRRQTASRRPMPPWGRLISPPRALAAHLPTPWAAAVAASICISAPHPVDLLLPLANPAYSTVSPFLGSLLASPCALPQAPALFSCRRSEQNPPSSPAHATAAAALSFSQSIPIGILVSKRDGEARPRRTSTFGWGQPCSSQPQASLPRSLVIEHGRVYAIILPPQTIDRFIGHLEQCVLGWDNSHGGAIAVHHSWKPVTCLWLQLLWCVLGLNSSHGIDHHPPFLEASHLPVFLPTSVIPPEPPLQMLQDGQHHSSSAATQDTKCE
ncbi:hypothetical protein U9M48_013748 [Paspalum notatum var. saurae]|uniref:Uncharacterized protein n=1 Tax=Paspalum notatum var. saurae TaxID=547442 RepID=A0AAQ3T0K0_PASNO